MSDSVTRLTTALADRYRIERELGAGGMATVYLAEDLKHHRRVAVKVLRPELAAVIGADRFLSEIRTTANLQHPHILPLFDSGATGQVGSGAGEFLFYVMPFVEGESLRDRLSREKQLPINDAVHIATEIASALDYAHRHNVIHRDIKPENILLHDGRALVADFGIALAASKAGSRMTETGMSLGTPQYMSPEQAMGERELDARSDVYALGCVTYEMLTGEPPFSGPTAQAIVAKVMTSEPTEATSLRKTIPAHVAQAVHSALQKLPADRFATAAEFAQALANPSFTSGTSRTTVPGKVAPGSGWSSRLPWALAAVLALTSLWLMRRGRMTSDGAGPVRFAVELQQSQSFLGSSSVLVTPDGRTVIINVLQGQESVLLARRLDSLDTRKIPGSEAALRPFLSTDGRWVGFSAHNKLVKLPIEGGTPVVLADATWGGGTWGPDGTIIYNPSYQSGLWRVSAAGGDAHQLTTPDSASGELSHWWPQLLPDGRHLLFTAYRTPVSKATIELLDIKTGKRTVLVTGGVMGRYAATGHLLFARDESILAVPFDPGRLRVTGAAVVVVDDVAMNVSAGFAAYDVSASGTLAVIPRAATNPDYQVVAVDRHGVEQVVVAEPDHYQSPRYSPDLQRIALDISPDRGNSDVWVIDLSRGTRTRVTAEPAADFGALWSRDGRDVIYISERPLFELYRRAADGSRPPVRLLGGGDDRITGSVSADGRRLAFVLSQGNGSELWTMALDGDASPRRYLSNGFYLGHPALSPDGHWIAYDSDESGHVEVYVQSFPDPTIVKHQVSSSGGAEPIWTRGGHELVFRHADSVIVTNLDPKTGTADRPATLFTGAFDSHPGSFQTISYDVSPDGQRFLLLKRAANNMRPQVLVTTGWWPELRARMATGAKP